MKNSQSNPEISNQPVMAKVMQGGCEFTCPRWLRVDFIPEEVNQLVGKAKTHIESFGLPAGQEKAAKDLIGQLIWGWVVKQSQETHQVHDDRECCNVPVPA